MRETLEQMRDELVERVGQRDRHDALLVLDAVSDIINTAIELTDAALAAGNAVEPAQLRVVRLDEVTPLVHAAINDAVRRLRPAKKTRKTPRLSPSGVGRRSRRPRKTKKVGKKR